MNASVAKGPRGSEPKHDIEAPRRFALTDLGNAERLVAKHGGRLRYCPPRKRWLTYSGLRWQWDETGGVVRLAKEVVRSIYSEASACGSDEQRQALAKHAAKSENAGRIKNMLELAKTEKGIPVLPRELDADPWLFNVKNGTIDLQTGELREHRSDDVITKMAPVDFDPYAEHGLWTKCVRDATGGDTDLTRYLRRIFGYALTGTAIEKALFFFFGPTDTAKSTILGAWQYALGDYAMSADFETWCARRDVGGNRGDLVRLMGARLVTSVETKRGAKLDEGLVKKVTGGDPIDAAAKYEAEVTFTPSFTLVLAANDAPRIRDDDDAMWGRMQRVPFEHVIAQPDPTFRRRLCTAEVGAAVLAWGVRGCLEWQEKGLRPPASVLASTEAYRAESDRFLGFAAESVDLDPDGSITRRRLRSLYGAWCEEEDVRPLSSKELATRMREFGASEGKSNGRRVWKGVRERTADGAAGS